MLQGITEEVKKQAEQPINSRFVYVPEIHDLGLENTQGGRRNGNSAGSQKLKAIDYMGSAKKCKKGIYVPSSTDQAYYRDQYKVVQPCEGSDTTKTEEHPENKQVVQWKRENMTRQS